MRVSDIFKEQQIDESLVEARLKTFDWKYEFSDDLRRVERGQKEMAVLESMVFHFWKTNPEKAVSLWNKYFPVKKQENVVPSFIRRLESQE